MIEQLSSDAVRTTERNAWRGKVGVGLAILEGPSGLWWFRIAKSIRDGKFHGLDLRARPQPDLLVDGRSARRASWGLKIQRAGPSGEAAAGFYRNLPARSKFD